jgi:hypothetical protein
MQSSVHRAICLSELPPAEVNIECLLVPLVDCSTIRNNLKVYDALLIIISPFQRSCWYYTIVNDDSNFQWKECCLLWRSHKKCHVSWPVPVFHRKSGLLSANPYMTVAVYLWLHCWYEELADGIHLQILNEDNVANINWNSDCLCNHIYV